MNATLGALLSATLMTATAWARNSIRVACVGDSITYGDELADRMVQSYPAVLERLSQGRLVAGNFGVNGATALKIPFRAWSDTDACREALAFQPAGVVIMLGINDLAFPDQYAQYPADLKDIAVRFQSLPSAPRIFLCTLTPIGPAEQQLYANRLIRNTLNPHIRTVAAEIGATLIDISAAFPNRPDLLPGGLHPGPEGAELIARTILAVLDDTLGQAPQIQPAPAAGPVDLSIRNEALAARHRAEEWMSTQPPPPVLPDPLALLADRRGHAPDDVADLLPLLEGTAPGPGADLFRSYAALAAALVRIGHETVFLADGRPVAWRAALLHRLVRSQQMDARGRGFWDYPEESNAATDSIRATAYALQALAIALGE